jgi:hypothetical protein
MTCTCGRCRPASAGEPGLWTYVFCRWFRDTANQLCRRDRTRPVHAGNDGITRCPNCGDRLHDDWSTSKAQRQLRLRIGG